MRPMPTEQGDAELVARCRAGDEAAWRDLVERFSRYVYAICVQAFRLSEHDAEDVFQDVFARVYERLDSLREDSAIRTSRCLAKLREHFEGRNAPPRPSGEQVM